MSDNPTGPTTTITDLRCEHQIDPLGIDIVRPRLGWQIASNARGVRQTAFQVAVARTPEDLVTLTNLVWDSGVVRSDQSIECEYDGAPLESRRRYSWAVRVWTGGDTPTPWATPAHWEMGLLAESDWSARWIEPEQRPAQPEAPFGKIDPSELGVIGELPPTSHDLLNPAQQIRKVFTVNSDIARARLYATAHGVYTVEVNGHRIDDRELAPDDTAYDDFLMYQTYDVTPHLVEGDNALGVTVADGWYAGRLGMTGAGVNYGDRLGVLLQLEVDYTDGTKQTIAADESFVSSSGPIQYADLLIGEKYDARLETPDWSTAAFDDSGWKPVNVAQHGYGNLVAQYGEPIRAVREFACVGVITTPAGDRILDFGQNVAGRVRMRVRGDADTTVTLEHSETLDADGNFFSNIFGRNNENTDVYVLKGQGVEVFEPKFTYHGFRYVRLTGYPGTVDPADFTCVALSSDSEVTGSFECSDPAVNQLQSNIQWTLRSNAFSVMTDNPDRERAGWTGDLQVIAPTAAFNLGLNSFVTRWMRNATLEQLDDGQIPMVVPFFKGYHELTAGLGASSCAAWGDVCIITPWTIYQTYGDRRIIEQTYDTMVRWMDYVQATAKSTIPAEEADDPQLSAIWRATAFHFGDWLTPSQTELAPTGIYDVGNALKTMELVPTVYYAHSADLLSKISALLGKEREQARYAALAAAVRAGFQKAFLREDGRLSLDLQGMYVLALQFDMVPTDMRSKLLDRLVELIHDNGDRLDTGFLSTPFLLPLLSDNGHNELAYTLLLQTECPSWLYQVANGATTVWEMWNSKDTSGEVSKTSQNQPGLTTIGDWLYRVVAGLNSDLPGYKHITVKPRPDGRISYADASYRSPHGGVATRWERHDDRLQVHVSIPGNTSATIHLPGAVLETVTEGGIPVANHPDIVSLRQAGDAAIVEVGSGHYKFTYPQRSTV